MKNSQEKSAKKMSKLKESCALQKMSSQFIMNFLKQVKNKERRFKPK